MAPDPSRMQWPRRILVAAALGAAVVAAALYLLRDVREPGAPPTQPDPGALEAAGELVRGTCSACHAYPPPGILPREVWPGTVRRMYAIAEEEGVDLPVSFRHAAAWYIFHAPDSLPPAEGRADAGPGALSWQVRGWSPPELPPGPGSNPGVTFVRFARLMEGAGDDLIVSDAPSNQVFVLRPYLPDAEPIVLDQVRHPARAEVVDLDGDGLSDLVVAALGEMRPTDDLVGSVVWFRRTGPAAFEPITLAEDLGRVADVRAADLQGDGRMDLVVAVFGWRDNGQLLWMENVGEEGGVPRFRHHVLDDRAGFTDVRIADLNGNGRLDVVGLVTQQWQEVMVYWAEDEGFRPEPVWSAPHPDWGLVGMEVVDFTGNGHLDVVVTNGDNLDVIIAKPQHGVGLLENQGDGIFHYHHLTHMYGAHRAEPVDLNGNGLLDLVVAAYLPPGLTMEPPDPPEALIWLERTGPTELVRRVLRSADPRHMTLAAGDGRGTGRADLALGWMDLGFADPRQADPDPEGWPWVTLWENQGPTADPAPAADPDPEAVAVIDWTRDR
jgi:hypothetical protein